MTQLAPVDLEFDQLMDRGLFPLLIPQTEIGRDDVFLVYSPLSSATQLANHSELTALNKRLAEHSESRADNELLRTLLDGANKATFVKIPKSPHEYTKLAILLNNKCNFCCEYCYSAKGRSNYELTAKDIDGILHYFIDPTRIKDRYIKFFISGGGEPLLSNEVLEYLLRQIDEKCSKHGFTYGATIITNGSLLSEKWIRMFLRYPSLHVSISFELDEAAQNKSRGHWEEVFFSIKTAIKNGVIPSITSTVMPDYVDKMPDMCERLLSDYPQISNWSCAPVILTDSSCTKKKMQQFYESFTENFFLIWKRMKSAGKSVGFSFFWNLEQLGNRFCQGKMCLTAQRDIVICPFSSSPEEEFYHKYQYGYLNQEGIPVFDQTKFSALMQENRERLKLCGKCFLRWHCAGICFNRNIQLRQYRDEICRFYRTFGSRYFREKFYQAFQEQTGENLTDYIKGL